MAKKNARSIENFNKKNPPKGKNATKHKFHKIERFITKPRTFETPDELWERFMDYCDNCNENPIIRMESVKSGPAAGTTFPVEMPHVMTLNGFAIYLGITRMTLNNYANKEDFKEYNEVYNRIKDIIDDYKLKHALVGNYDARLTMSMLGLAEKKKFEQSVNLQFGEDEQDV